MCLVMASDSCIATRYRLLRRLTLMMPDDFFDVLRQLGDVPIEKLKPSVQASPFIVVGHRTLYGAWVPEGSAGLFLPLSA